MNHVSGGGGEPLGHFRAPHGPRCFQVHFIEHSYTAVQTARYSEWGPAPWEFWAQLLVVLSGAPWQFRATVLWGDVPKHEVQRCDPELWCVCSRLEMGLDQAIPWQSTIPVKSLTACDYTFIWDSCLLSHPLTCAIPPASGEQIKDIRISLD